MSKLLRGHIAVMGAILLMLLASCSVLGDQDAAGDGAAAEEPLAREAVATGAGYAPTSAALTVTELSSGEGTQVEFGDRVTVHVVGSWESGEQIESTWETGEPYVFTIGGDEVIEGWQRGIIGMSKGGRRRVSVPGELVTGGGGTPAAEQAAGETLTYVFELVDVG